MSLSVVAMKFDHHTDCQIRVALLRFEACENVSALTPVTRAAAYRLAIYRGLEIYEELNPWTESADPSLCVVGTRSATLDKAWPRVTFNLSPEMLERVARVAVSRGETRVSALRHLAALGAPVLIFEARRGVVL